MKVAILVRDCGDGSVSLNWFKDHLLAEKLCQDIDNTLSLNDGDPEIIDVPDDWEPRGGFDDEYYSKKLNIQRD